MHAPLQNREGNEPLQTGEGASSSAAAEQTAQTHLLRSLEEELDVTLRTMISQSCYNNGEIPF